MKTLYRAGRMEQDGFPSYIEGAVFTTKEAAESLHEKFGTSQEVVVFDSVEEFRNRELFEKKRRARMALMQKGYSEKDAKELIP